VFRRPKLRLQLPSRTLLLGGRTLIVGVLNATPDSFSDGGKYLDPRAALRRALEMQAQGADILELGGESTRPGSRPVSAEIELSRVLPVLACLQGRISIPISIDTQKAVVARAAVEAGAEIVNDVSALRTDPALAEVIRRARAAVVLMHMRGRPATMQKRPFARNVMADVERGLLQALERARRAGIPRARVVLDPGIGFGKSVKQNCEVLARLPELARLGCPLLVGTSRKSFLQTPGGGAPGAGRIWGTAASVAMAIAGGAHLVRVHDVAEMAEVARVADTIAGRTASGIKSGKRTR